MKTGAVIEHIVSWLSDYLDRSGSRGFVVGISGGIDSAVASSLGALTGKPLLCAEMPIHQSPAQVSRARHHIESLEKRHDNVTSIEVELTEIFDRLVAALPSDDEAARKRFVFSYLRHLPYQNGRLRILLFREGCQQVSFFHGEMR